MPKKIKEKEIGIKARKYANMLAISLAESSIFNLNLDPKTSQENPARTKALIKTSIKAAIMKNHYFEQRLMPSY
jgi:hypothetical protein